MIDLTTLQDETSRPDLMTGLYRLRYRVFIDRLGWALNTGEALEKDEFDTANALHIVFTDDDDGEPLGCIRTMPTTQPHLLTDIFPYLNAADPIRAPRIWETSRFAVDVPEAKKAKFRNGALVTSSMLCGLLEFGLEIGLTHFVSVSNTRIERILNRSGFTTRRLGVPHLVAGINAVGLMADVSTEKLDAVRARSGVTERMLQTSTIREVMETAAA